MDTPAVAIKPLHDYQEVGIQFLMRNKRVILGDAPRVRKTRQAIEALKRLNAKEPLNKIMIAVPGNAVFVWQDQLKEWWPEGPDFVLIRGKPEDRVALWDERFIIVSYGILKRDYKIGVARMHWHAFISDEAHKWRNRKTQLYKTIKAINCVYAFLLTGTPASRGPQDLWTLLNFLQPRVWTSYWKYIQTYCITSQGMWGGLEIIGTKNMPFLQEQLKNVLLRRTKKDVRPELPPLQRELYHVAMTPLQSSLYKSLAEDMLSESIVPEEYDPIIASDVLAKITRLRQLLVCPKLLDPNNDYGGAILSIIDDIADYIEEDRHAVIFSVFPSAFPFFKEILNEAGFQHVFILEGGMSPEDMRSTVNDFVQSKGIMLCSLLYAQSFSLATAQAAYVIGYDWDPSNNYQAESRLDDMESPNPKIIYYMQCKGTVDDRTLEINDNKQSNVNALFRQRMTAATLRDQLFPEGNIGVTLEQD